MIRLSALATDETALFQEIKVREAALYLQTPIRTVKRDRGSWVPARAGTEKPVTTASGRKLLRCWHTIESRHGYLDMDHDVMLTEVEGRAILAA